jgi:hypothetical protein
LGPAVVALCETRVTAQADGSWPGAVRVTGSARRSRPLGIFAGMATAPATYWDLAGRLLMSAEGVDETQRDAIAAELDPFVSQERTGDPDLIVGHLPSPELLEMQGPANDQRMTAVALDGRLLARFGSRWVGVPTPHESPVRVDVQTGLDIGLCWREVIRPAMHQALRHRDAVAVHGAAVDGGPTGGTIVSGWSESGKTEVALALVEAGASFLSDKWTVAGPDGDISAFPVGVGVRGWVMTSLPRLQTSLPRRARAQLRAARLVRAGAGPLLDRAGSGRVTRLAAGMVTRAVELGDRAALSPTEIREAYGQADDPARRARLTTVLLLVTGANDRVLVEEAPPEWAARRLARTAAYERRSFYDLQERGAYAGLPDRAGARDAAIATEERLLAGVMDGASRVLRVTCPFPCDPRRVIDALATYG